MVGREVMRMEEFYPFPNFSLFSFISPRLLKREKQISIPYIIHFFFLLFKGCFRAAVMTDIFLLFFFGKLEILRKCV